MLRYDIEHLEIDGLKTLRPLLEAYEYKPYHYFRGLKNEQLSDSILEQLNSHLQSPDGSNAYLARREIELVGLANMRLLPWDKQIFAKDMAAIDYLMAIGNYKERVSILNGLLSKLIKRCKDLKIEHLSCRVDTADLACINALEEVGFKLMDIVVTYCFDFAKSSLKELEYPFRIRSQEREDIESIVALSKLSFKNYIDRFHSDPTLDDQSCDQLYAEWARNSCLRLVADQVFVAEGKGKIVGFSTCKFHKEVNRFIDHKIGEIVLVCVSPEARGSGVYTSFIHHGLDWFRTKVDFVQVVTQINNTFVQRAWSNLDFRPIGSRSTFHKWLQGAG